jgi:uncharacterized protein
MFPLGSVLLPTGILPLHVFEERYRAMVRDCIAADEPEFGVVLIARGSEVGGGEVRMPIGTVARILEVQQFPDGRSALITAGVRRFEVVDWLPDDPYPRAEVIDLFDSDPTDELAEMHANNLTLLRRVLALKAELGDDASPSTIELDDDPVVGGYQLCVVAPFGPADHYRLLAAPDALSRARIAHELLVDERAVCAFRLAELASGSPTGVDPFGDLPRFESTLGDDAVDESAGTDATNMPGEDATDRGPDTEPNPDGDDRG